MASRGGAPSDGSWAQSVAFSAARTKASKILFETISTGVGCDEVGARFGVDYVSTRQVSSGDVPKSRDWPDLKEWKPWKREVMSTATVVPLLARFLGAEPPDAPTVEALMREYDVDAVCEAFLEGSYYLQVHLPG